ncbi:hypothetical protein GCK72_010958 [Caenorhabditis remanei]|uniref:Uncharacterized protein n=1 Tax=Caenorhabditis remanei TaxID=31234 RepID=A0A6A5H756_CAERE|nr:hypothetical protein GCK72_010958 [Caenorhabditis remanei]KAF1762696.1 hypothetical protein GCK72_010958 [Caenorhabditis remanei]
MIGHLYTHLDFLKIHESVVDIRQTTANKAFMETMSPDGYEVVHPFQIRDKNERIGIDTRNYFLKAQEHYSHVTIVIRSNQLGRLKLVLERNNFIFLNQTAFHKLDADGERVLQNRVENCYYQGTVGGEESSFVALSSCNGLRGVISFANGTTYGIWPLDGGDRNSRRHPHILYKSEWTKEAKCGSSMAHAVGQRIRRGAEPDLEGAEPILEKPRKHKHRKHHRRHMKDEEEEEEDELKIRVANRRDASKRTKYVEVALIADYEFMKQRGLHDMDAISYMLESLNIADSMLSRDLNIRLSAVYVELWSDVQRIDLWEDIERTLSGVVDYAAGHIYHIQKDASILFTAGSFANQEVSNAAIRSICTARSAVIVRAIEPFATHWNGELVAQSVGHLLGLEHDTTACSCEPSPECVMRQQPGRVGAPFSWQFSKCSVARMHGIWQDGNIQCLLNKPFQVSELRECGNGIVDGSEECDCGTRENCNDPCCDPLTCTLRPHAQCAAHHKCCHRCELRKAGETCRSSQSPCDVAESCDGKSGDCPPDGHLIDGTVCGNDGQCWRGNCSDSHQQCQKLWGREARVAEEVCFEQNTKGAEYANCGMQSDGSYHPCQLEDTKCGTLHCHSGSLTPTDSTLKAFTFHFTQNAQQIQCKSIAGSLSGLIQDGTNCGSGKVCVAGSCVEMSSVSSGTACPTNNLALLCSGHGHCTTTAKCVCFNGWTGNACDIRSNTSTYQGSMGFRDEDHEQLGHGGARKTIMIPHLNIGTTLETAYLFGILFGFGAFLLLCLVCLMLCYRRRSVVEIPKPSDEKLEESPDRQIKFGNMPSYREEKRKRKSNKRIYGALNRITEADERDSTSLRSRDSAGSQQLLDRNGQPVMAGIRDPYSTDHHIYAESVAASSSNRQFRGINSDGSYPLRSFGSWRSSAPISPASSSGHLTDVSNATTPLRLNKIGKLLKTMQQSDDEAGSPFSDHSMQFQNQGIQNLQSLQNHSLLGRLDHGYTGEEELSAVEADHDVGSNTESSRGCEDSSGGRDSGGWDPPSLVNGSTSNNYNFRQSPSLFSDPFKLEMTNSMHN